MEIDEQDKPDPEAVLELTEHLADVPEGDLVVQVKTTDKILYDQLQKLKLKGAKPEITFKKSLGFEERMFEVLIVFGVLRQGVGIVLESAKATRETAKAGREIAKATREIVKATREIVKALDELFDCIDRRRAKDNAHKTDVTLHTTENNEANVLVEPYRDKAEIRTRKKDKDKKTKKENP